jgi:hypothetical protein
MFPSVASVIEEQLKILYRSGPCQKALCLGNGPFRWHFVGQELLHPDLALLADRANSGQQFDHACGTFGASSDYGLKLPPAGLRR